MNLTFTKTSHKLTALSKIIFYTYTNSHVLWPIKTIDTAPSLMFRSYSVFATTGVEIMSRCRWCNVAEHNTFPTKTRRVLCNVIIFFTSALHSVDFPTEHRWPNLTLSNSVIKINIQGRLLFRRKTIFQKSNNAVLIVINIQPEFPLSIFRYFL